MFIFECFVFGLAVLITIRLIVNHYTFNSINDIKFIEAFSWIAVFLWIVFFILQH